MNAHTGRGAGEQTAVPRQTRPRRREPRQWQAGARSGLAESWRETALARPARRHPQQRRRWRGSRMFSHYPADLPSVASNHRPIGGPTPIEFGPYPKPGECQVNCGKSPKLHPLSDRALVTLGTRARFLRCARPRGRSKEYPRAHSDLTEPLAPAALSSQPRASARDPGPRAKIPHQYAFALGPGFFASRNSGMTVTLADRKVL